MILYKSGMRKKNEFSASLSEYNKCFLLVRVLDLLAKNHGTQMEIRSQRVLYKKKKLCSKIFHMLN